MSITLYNATLHDGLFDILGGVIIAEADINTARGSTLPFDIQRLLVWFNTLTPNSTIEPTIQNVTNIATGYQSGAASTMSVLQQFAQNFVIALAAQDKTQPDSTLTTALSYVIAQMKAQGQTLNASTLSCSIAATTTNTGNGVVLLSTKRGDGLVQENALSESIAVTCISGGTTGSLKFTGQQTASGSLGQDWPKGSGIALSVSAIDANSSSLLTNGGMETQTNLANVPDNWILSVGTPGTHCLMTVNAQQSVAISGSPTGGAYQLVYTDQNGIQQTTSEIAWNAVGSAVQTALTALVGLSKVTVGTDTGTSPNLTHPVTFTGAGGNVPLLQVNNFLTGGSNPQITVTTTVAGTPQVYAGGAAVQFKSDGATLTTINQKVSLSPSTTYGVSLWACTDVVPAAGVVTIDLVNGIGGTVLLDGQGNAQSISFNASALHSSFQHLSVLQSGECFLRTPASLPANVYLRIRISTAVTNGSSIFIDNVGLTAAQQLYSGGPYVAIFGGNMGFSTADTWTLTVTNGRQGVLREWCERNFSMSTLGLLFPTSASPTIPDTVTTAYAGQLNFVLAPNSEYLPLFV